MNRLPVPDGHPSYRFPVEPWRLVETAYSHDDLGVTETLFAVGNGYLGRRANPEAGREAPRHGPSLTGFHATWRSRHAAVAFGFARVPMQFFPIVAKNVAQRIAGRQRYPDTELALRVGLTRLNEIMRMVIVHAP